MYLSTAFAVIDVMVPLNQTGGRYNNSHIPQKKIALRNFHGNPNENSR